MRLSFCPLVALLSFLATFSTTKAQYEFPDSKAPVTSSTVPASVTEAPAASGAPAITQAAANPGGCAAQDVLFVVDSTGSVKDDYEKHKQFVLDVIEGLNVAPAAHQIGVVLYSSKLRQQIRIPLGAHDTKEALVAAVHELPFFAGITETGAALKLAKTALSERRPGVVVNFVVVTDGFSFDYVKEAIEDIRTLENVRTFAAGVAHPLGEQELLILAGAEDHVFKGAESASALAKKMTECSDGGSAKNPESPVATSAPGSHSGNATDETTTRASHPAPPTNSNETTPAAPAKNSNGTNPAPPGTGPGKCVLDILFVIDASGSVTQRFTKELELASQLVDRLTVGPENAKVALIRYAGKGKEKTIFGFDKYKEKEEIRKAINEVSFLGGTTATNDALILADTEVDETRGARPGIAEPIVIVFTDGYSQQDPQPGATKLHEKKITVYAVGIVEQYPVNLSELEVIAGDKTRVYTEKTINEFQAELDRLTSDC